MARDGAETDAAVARDPDRETIDAPGGSHAVVVVTEPEHAGPLRDEATGGNARAEDLVATLGADLEEDVLAARVHVREALGREQRLEAEAARLPVRVDATPVDGHREDLAVGTAGGILEVREAVAVVVDTVAADLRGGLHARVRGRRCLLGERGQGREDPRHTDGQSEHDAHAVASPGYGRKQGVCPRTRMTSGRSGPQGRPFRARPQAASGMPEPRTGRGCGEPSLRRTIARGDGGSGPDRQRQRLLG